MLLYVVEKFPSKTEHFIANEIRGLYEAGIQLMVLSMRKETSDESSHSLPVIYIGKWEVLWNAMKSFMNKPIPGQFLKHKNMRSSLRQIKVAAIGKVAHSKLKMETIQHVHAHFAFLPTEIAQHLAQKLGTEFSFTAHAKDLYANDINKLQSFMSQAKFVITCTKFGKAFLQKISPGTKNIHCIHHGVSLKHWPFQRVKHRKPNITRILYVGRLVEKKGIHILLEALHQMVSSGKQVQCTLVGSGPLSGKLMSRVKALDLSKYVTFMGYVPHVELVGYYKSHDLLVCPSIPAKNRDMDGMPNVMLEAMAVGLPVIASDLSGIPEIIVHGETGMLFKSGDASGILKHIEALSVNPLLYEKIRTNARKQLEEKFDLDDSNQQLEVILKTAIAS